MGNVLPLPRMCKETRVVDATVTGDRRVKRKERPAAAKDVVEEMDPASNVQSKSNELLMAAGQGDVEQIKRLLQQHEEEDAARQVVLHVEDEEDVVNGHGPAAAAIAEAVTATGDSILHVVTGGGDPRFLESASVIVGRANRLLGARNGKGDTPLHCAARLGNARMVSHLLALALASSAGDGDERVKAILRTQNGKGETVLHEAIRLEDKDMVGVLLSADSQLARVPLADGASPLYLALWLGHGDIARQLFEGDEALSYSGPDGRNAFHAAILGMRGRGITASESSRRAGDDPSPMSPTRSRREEEGRVAERRPHRAHRQSRRHDSREEAIKMLLERNKDLLKQADRSTGSTPLHLAATCSGGDRLQAHRAVARVMAVVQRFGPGRGPLLARSRPTWTWGGPMGLLLKAGPAAAYLADKNGSFPIHLAAFECEENAVSALLQESGPYCAELRDGKGRTFLHVAAEAESFCVVTSACRWQGKLFASAVMNMQDDDGNTALHLAVLAGNTRAVCDLVSIPEVKLYVSNNKRQTPLETAFMTAFIREHSAASAFYGDPRYRIYHLLRDACGWTGWSWRPRIELSWRKFKFALREMDRSQNIAGQTQIIGLGSVLITTVTFAAAFAVPGGYRADDHDKGGTPTLAGHYSFDAFVIANTLAFICSTLSFLFLMYAGVGPNVEDRMIYLLISVNLLASSARSLGVTFALGMYSILAPVERTKAMYSCMIITVFPLVLVEIFLSIRTVPMVYSDNRAVMARRFASQQARWWRLARGVLMDLVVLVGLIVIAQYWPYILVAAMSR